MTPAAALTLTAAAALLLVGSRREGGPIEAGEGDWMGGLDLAALVDRGEKILNTVTEQAANVDMTTAQRNIAAFLEVIKRSEGTAGRGDYRVVYGYRKTLQDLSDHPAITGEWPGERLPDAMCQAAGFSPGCITTAAGAYQMVKGTWRAMRDKLRLPDFGPASQDAAAVELIRMRGALQDVQAGRLAEAVHKCRNEWASLPGNYARQGQHSMSTLASWYENAGGTYA